LAIITDSNNKSLEVIKKHLLELNLLNFYDFWLCEEIGFENEKIRKLNLKESLPSDISSLNIVVLKKTKKNYSNNNLPLFGISDHIFKTFDDRPNLLTKREVRVQILAALELPRNGVIWDIGAGCGSIGLEALKLRPNLHLFCIDKRIGSKSLILENSKRLGVKPKYIFEENIINTLNARNLSSFEKPNRLVIGGCDKKTKLQIITKLGPGMSVGSIIVIPIIDIQIINELKVILEKGISNNNQWKIWSRNGIEGVSRHFSWNTHVRNYLSILTKEFSRSISYSSSDIKQSCLKGSSSLIKPH